ncbi:hypothetical protein NL676_032798 [Syzygium grande]|nr:hypothetical protein NL676_032798 [Syzygium grande]
MTSFQKLSRERFVPAKSTHYNVLPPLGVLKLNVDAAVSTTQVSIATLARERRDHVLYNSISGTHALSALEAEGEAQELGAQAAS